MSVAHVTIHSADFESSVDFYREIVGLDIIRELKAADRHIVFLAEEKNETAIEIIKDEKALPVSGGISVGFRCEDIEAKHRFCEERGLAPGEIIAPGPDVRFFFIKDPNGVTIQFI